MSEFSEILRGPDSLERMSVSEKKNIGNRLVSLLGKNFELAEVEPATVKIKHSSTGIEFSLIPGGEMIMGLNEYDLNEIANHVSLELVEYSIEIDGAFSTPSHKVKVHPFLCACKSLENGTMSRLQALSAVTSLGFRLPSEIELEWILRDGGRYGLTLGAKPALDKPGSFVFQQSRYGIENLLVANWAADDWHANYAGAPSESIAWMNGDPVGVCRSTFPLVSLVSEEDVAVLLAALRAPGCETMPAVARPTLSLPTTH